MMADDALWASLKELRDATETDLMVVGQDPKTPRRGIGSKGSLNFMGGLKPISKEESSDTAQGASSTTSLNELASLSAQLVEEEQWDAALEVVSEEHELNRLEYGESDPRTLEVLGTYAGVLWQLGRGEDARELLEELVEKRTALVVRLGSRGEAGGGSSGGEPDGAADDQPEQLLNAQAELADCLVELSTVLSEMGRPADAVPLLRRAMALQTVTHGETSFDVMTCNDMLARALADSGHAAEVVPTLRRSLDLKRAVHGEASQEVADAHNELAVALQEMGEPSLAEEEARSALSLHIDLFGESHMYTGTCISNLATLLQAQGKLHPAEMLLRHCLRIYESELGPTHEDSVEVIASLVDVLWFLRRVDEACSLLTRQLELQACQPDIDPVVLAQGHAALGGLHQERGDLPAAVGALDKAEQNYALALAALDAQEAAAAARAKGEGVDDVDDEEAPDPDELAERRVELRTELASALNSLGIVLQEQEHPEKALPHLLRSVELYESTMGEQHAFVGIGHHNLGLVRYELGQVSQARYSLETAVSVCHYSLGTLSKDFRGAVESLRHMLAEEQIDPETCEPLRLAEEASFHDAIRHVQNFARLRARRRLRKMTYIPLSGLPPPPARRVRSFRNPAAGPRDSFSKRMSFSKLEARQSMPQMRKNASFSKGPGGAGLPALPGNASFSRNPYMVRATASFRKQHGLPPDDDEPIGAGQPIPFGPISEDASQQRTDPAAVPQPPSRRRRLESTPEWDSGRESPPIGAGQPIPFGDDGDEPIGAGQPIPFGVIGSSGGGGGSGSSSSGGGGSGGGGGSSSGGGSNFQPMAPPRRGRARGSGKLAYSDLLAGQVPGSPALPAPTLGHAVAQAMKAVLTDDYVAHAAQPATTPFSMAAIPEIPSGRESPPIGAGQPIPFGDDDDEPIGAGQPIRFDARGKPILPLTRSNSPPIGGGMPIPFSEADAADPPVGLGQPIPEPENPFAVFGELSKNAERLLEEKKREAMLAAEKAQKEWELKQKEWQQGAAALFSGWGGGGGGGVGDGGAAADDDQPIGAGQPIPIPEGSADGDDQQQQQGWRPGAALQRRQQPGQPSPPPRESAGISPGSASDERGGEEEALAHGSGATGPAAAAVVEAAAAVEAAPADAPVGAPAASSLVDSPIPDKPAPPRRGAWRGGAPAGDASASGGGAAGQTQAPTVDPASKAKAAAAFSTFGTLASVTPDGSGVVVDDDEPVGAGQEIRFDADGKPIFAPPPKPIPIPAAFTQAGGEAPAEAQPMPPKRRAAKLTTQWLEGGESGKGKPPSPKQQGPRPPARGHARGAKEAAKRAEALEAQRGDNDDEPIGAGQPIPFGDDDDDEPIGAGQEIRFDADGKPIFAPPPKPIPIPERIHPDGGGSSHVSELEPPSRAVQRLSTAATAQWDGQGEGAPSPPQRGSRKGGGWKPPAVASSSSSSSSAAQASARRSLPLASESSAFTSSTAETAAAAATFRTAATVGQTQAPTVDPASKAKAAAAFSTFGTLASVTPDGAVGKRGPPLPQRSVGKLSSNTTALFNSPPPSMPPVPPRRGEHMPPRARKATPSFGRGTAGGPSVADVLLPSWARGQGGTPPAASVPPAAPSVRRTLSPSKSDSAIDGIDSPVAVTPSAVTPSAVTPSATVARGVRAAAIASLAPGAAPSSAAGFAPSGAPSAVPGRLSASTMGSWLPGRKSFSRSGSEPRLSFSRARIQVDPGLAPEGLPPSLAPAANAPMGSSPRRAAAQTTPKAMAPAVARPLRDAHDAAHDAALERARKHLMGGRARMAEASLREALTAHEALSSSSTPKRQAQWVALATLLVQTLLKQPALAKLLEAELLMWRCFELSVQSAEVCDSMKKRREMFDAHNGRLQLLHQAQLQTAARAIQAAFRRYAREVKAGAKPTRAAARRKQQQQRRGKPETRNKAAAARGNAASAYLAAVSGAKAAAPSAAPSSAALSSMAKGGAPARDKADETKEEMKVAAGAEMSDDTCSECEDEDVVVTAKQSSHEGEATAGDAAEGAGGEAGGEARSDGASAVTSSARAVPASVRQALEEAPFEAVLIWEPSRRERLKEYSPPKVLERTPSFERLLRGLPKYLVPMDSDEIAKRLDELERQPPPRDEPSARGQSLTPGGRVITPGMKAAVPVNPLNWRPESYLEQRMRLRSGIVGGAHPGLTEGSSVRANILRKGRSAHLITMSSLAANGENAENEGGGGGEANGGGGGGKTKSAWRPAPEKLQRARLEAARRAAIAAMGSPDGHGGRGGRGGGSGARPSELRSALDKYRSLGLHDFDLPQQVLQQQQQQQAAAEHAAAHAPSPTGGSGAPESGAPKSLLLNGRAAPGPDGAAAGGTAAGEGAAAKKLNKAEKLAPMRKGGGGGGLGNSVSALLSRSRSTRKAIRSGGYGFLGVSMKRTASASSNAPTSAAVAEEEEAATKAAASAPEPVALLDDGPLNRLRDCKNSPTTAAELAVWLPFCTCDTCTTKVQVKWVRRCESEHNAIWLSQVHLDLDFNLDDGAREPADKSSRRKSRRSSRRPSSRSNAAGDGDLLKSPSAAAPSARLSRTPSLTIGLGEMPDFPTETTYGGPMHDRRSRGLWRRLSSSLAGMRDTARSRSGRLSRSLSAVSLTPATSTPKSARLRSKSFLVRAFREEKRREASARKRPSAASYPPMVTPAAASAPSSGTRR